MENQKYDNVCGISRFLDMLIWRFLDKPKNWRMPKSVGTKDRPRPEELSQLLRVLIISLAETAIINNCKSLISSIDRNDDLACAEKVLQMLLSLLGEPIFLSSFWECVHALGGIHIFLNLLTRQQESIRLLALQTLGTLFLAIPIQKKSIWISSNKGQTDIVANDSVWLRAFANFPVYGGFAIDSVRHSSWHRDPETNLFVVREKRSWLRQLQNAGNPAHTALLKFVEVSGDCVSRHDVLKDVSNESVQLRSSLTGSGLVRLDSQARAVAI